MKVAVITRTKDREDFLRRAIESVKNQSFRDYVHAIVNDGGDSEIVESIVNSLPDETRSKIKVFHRKESSGAPDTIFNESIDTVDSDYFAIHDDDDTWHPDFLYYTVDHLDKNNKLGAVTVRTDRVDEVYDGKNIVTKRVTRWMPDIKVISLYRQCIDNQMTPISTLYRRSAYADVGKFDSTLPVVGDWEFGVRLLLKYDVDYIDPGYALANYHHRRYKEGIKGNTSFAGNDKHRYYTNLVMNRYLRSDLSRGKFGVGYIMSSIKYNQNYTAEMVKRILPNKLSNIIRKKTNN